MNLIRETVELPTFTLAPSAEQVRALMIEAAKMVTQVTNPVEQSAASLQGVAIQAHIKEVKAMRLALAKPLNDACDKLIQIEKDYLAPLLEQKERLSLAVTGYQMEEAERVRREETARAAEVARLEAERHAAEAKASRAKSEAGQLKAELVAHQASQAVQELVRAPLPEPVKARGSATRRELRHVVTDIKALYAARPELCTVEVRPSVIKALFNPPATADRAHPDKSIPGLLLYWELSTSFRS